MRELIFATLILAMVGCTTVSVSVQEVHKLSGISVGSSYAIVPSNEQAGSFEFSRFEKLVKAELTKIGWVERPFEESKFAILMRYGIDANPKILYRYPVFERMGDAISSTTGKLTFYCHGENFCGSTYDSQPYVERAARTDPKLARVLNIEIVDITKLSNGKAIQVYEGKAVSIGAARELSEAMPAMIKGFFDGFPGASGKTRSSKQCLR